ncbi:capsular polysaccharide biosynthesis protein [Neisseria sp. Dent CA1/247]|uniref:capsular polysaccharide biosynthesis protein n=1 Tax=Neisseria sp. Dent CA1/247 TaxID=2912675 RepID=UPI001FD340A8|nr:capsular polysaccharide biosynthesis protein [Neisseria sp. Dent CA1/247]UOO77235.1 capsular polysaccharide biosynthesis protein [Neisseria sp. Dent CA1/247]
MNTAFIFTKGIRAQGVRKLPYLTAFLPELAVTKDKAKAESIVDWGLLPTNKKARDYAAKHHLPFIALEDGFLRSLGLGVEGWPPYSVVFDDTGIYYDTTRPSRLEQLILNADTMPSEILDDAEKAIKLILDNKLSKYNHAPEYPANPNPRRPSEKKTVLVIDQTAGDMAVKYGSADENTFKHMFQTALSENPDAEIWVKTHPDVLSGKKRGYLTDISLQAGNVRVLAEDINPISLLEQADKVYCVTSQMGFEAMMMEKPVVTFGLPWYAGWGISDDRHPAVHELYAQNRRANRNMIRLFAAAYFQYSRYVNPNTGDTGTLFDVIDYLASARRLNEKLRGNLYCLGMTFWKRAVVKPFLNVPSCRPHFISSFGKLKSLTLPADAKILAWGVDNEDVAAFARQHNLPLLRMEDGFVRSVGLGSNLVPPLSLVTDDMGIYFNPNTLSRLEHILQNQTFSQKDFQTASYLQRALTESEISKYNVGKGRLNIPDTSRKVLLVPGQVEDDASIRYGSPEIRTNLGLLKKVRGLNPDAYIIYKPHPDVVSGNRVGAIPPEEASRYADQTVTDCDIITCLKYAGEVHTMTSLSGFEALLRGKTVHCYGLPFYAGWGLTHDHLNLPRRTRKLALWELVAGTLIHYPDYVDPETKHRTDVTTAISILSMQKTKLQHRNLLPQHLLSKQWGKFKQIYSLFK